MQNQIQKGTIEEKDAGMPRVYVTQTARKKKKFKPRALTGRAYGICLE